MFKLNLKKLGREIYKKEEQEEALKNVEMLYIAWENVIELFDDCFTEVKYKTSYGEKIKILTPKQIIQRLLVAIAQVRTVNTTENLVNEIRQIIYFLSRANKITEKVYSSITNSIQLLYKVDTIFMNSENSKASDPHRLLLNPIGKK